MTNHFQSFPPLLAFVFFILMALKILKRSKTDPSTFPVLPPSPKRLPIIGNMHHFTGSEPHRCLRNLANKYGSIMHLQLGEVSYVVISSPETAKEVLKTHDIVFAQRSTILAASIIFYNSQDILFAPYGDYWRQLKKLTILELLSVKRVQSFGSIKNEEMSNLITRISSFVGKTFNFSRMLFSLMYGITARASFGSKCKDQEEFIPVAQEITKATGALILEDLFPSITFLPMMSGMRSKLMRLHKQADRIIENIINDHKARKKSLTELDGSQEENLLDVLLRHQENGNIEFSLSNNNIKAVILDIFIAGSDTSATTVEWAMSEMLKNPRVMQKAQEEVRKVFGNKGNVDETRIHELKYLQLVINETLRLHPPVPLIPRESRERCEINGYEIPAKTRAIVNAWAIGRDPNLWKEAETFYPERFIDSPIDYKGRNFEFIPFGAGKRMCPGMAFGIANSEFTVAQFLYHFDWKLQDGMKPENLDMIEGYGGIMRRKNDLHLIPVPHSS